jgi:hypothetical protein
VPEAPRGRFFEEEPVELMDSLERVAWKLVDDEWELLVDLMGKEWGFVLRECLLGLKELNWE